MKRKAINCGYVPLVDAAPLVLARELGFAEDEGIALNLLRQPSWSALRDLLALGHLHVAHMLSPMPIAMSLGLGGLSARVDALMVLSVNGNVLGVSPPVAQGMRDAGWDGEFAEPVATANWLLKSVRGKVRLGSPFPFSMHTELIHYWLAGAGVAADRFEIKTVPPSLMADAVAEDEIDAFCVGEPWGSVAVEKGAGELILPGSAIWSFAPEKVLGARNDWIEANADLVAALMRAVWRASAWLDQPENRVLASEMLARSEHLDVPDAILDRALAGRLCMRQREMARLVPDFLLFHGGAANFPWRSQAAWIAAGLAARHQLDPFSVQSTARAAFRADLYRANLTGLGVDMPGASEKIEGSLAGPEAVASTRGGMILRRNQFFDGRVFDPASGFAPKN